MWTTSNKDRCLRSVLLVINFAACVAIVYIYVTYVDKQGKVNGLLSEHLIQPEKLTAEECIPVCDSRACIWHANMMLKSIDTTVPPCEDFHAFLCNGFKEEFGEDERANTISETRKLMISRLKDLLDNIHAEYGSASSKMKTVYDSCVDYGSSELQGITDLKRIFDNIGIPNWPNIPEDFSFNNVSLPVIVGSFLGLGTSNYVALRDVFKNETQENRLLVTFYSYVFNTSTEVSRELAVSYLNYFDLEMGDIDSIIEDHRLVKNFILNLSEPVDKCYNETCAEVHIDCSRQNDDEWHDLCETLHTAVSFLGIERDHMKAITIEKPEDAFFKDLFQLLHSFSKRSLCNFFALSFIKGYQEELNFYFRLAKLKNKDFEHEILVDFYELDRWKHCVRWIADNMKLPLANEFFHRCLTSAATEEITNNYHDYLSEITDLIVLQEWIPTDVKSQLNERIGNVSLNIDLIRKVLPNDTFVNKIYEEFHPTKDSFFQNVLQIKKVKRALKSLKEEEAVVYLADFDVQATVGGPTLDIHFGMLLPPFYIPDHTRVLNRALLAPIIGHEFGHYVFGLFEIKLADDETFLQKRRCVQDQFSNFKFRYLNENLNGSKYDSENFPDNVGTTLIDKVFEQYSASQDTVLPGLPYSTKQLFYMAASQMWCSKSSLEKDLLYKNKDPHAPTEYRLVGIMQNTKGHAEAFQCPVGSFMNPATKCSLLDTKRS